MLLTQDISFNSVVLVITCVIVSLLWEKLNFGAENVIYVLTSKVNPVFQIFCNWAFKNTFWFCRQSQKNRLDFANKNSHLSY